MAAIERVDVPGAFVYSQKIIQHAVMLFHPVILFYGACSIAAGLMAVRQGQQDPWYLLMQTPMFEGWSPSPPITPEPVPEGFDTWEAYEDQKDQDYEYKETVDIVNDLKASNTELRQDGAFAWHEVAGAVDEAKKLIDDIAATHDQETADAARAALQADFDQLEADHAATIKGILEEKDPANLERWL